MKVSLWDVAHPPPGPTAVAREGSLGSALADVLEHKSAAFSPQMWFQLRLFSRVALGDAEPLQHLWILLLRASLLESG